MECLKGSSCFFFVVTVFVDFGHKNHPRFNLVDPGIRYPFDGFVAQGAFQQTLGVADTA